MARVVKINRAAKRKKVKKKRFNKSSFRSFLSWTFVSLSAIALAISYVSVLFDPTKFWPPMFFGLYFVPLVILNVCLLVIGLLHRNRSSFITFLVLLPSLLIADKFVKIGSEQTARNGDSIKVITYNLGRYKAGRGKMTSEMAIDGVKRFLKNENADIVCLQEFMAEDTALIAKYLPDYKYSSKHFFKGTNYFGNITLSKYPVIGSDVIQFKNSTNLVVCSDIKIGSRMLRVFNCHLESYSISFTSLIKRISKKGAFPEEFASVHLKVKETNIRRAMQVKAVLDNEEASSLPTLVCGDFNDTPVSYAYNKLTKRKKDSFVEAGYGFSATYSTLWPLLRIDYILFPEEYSADKHRIDRIPFSDHYPVTTNIYFKQ